MIPCARQRPVAASSPTDVHGPTRNGWVFAAASRGRSSWSGLLRFSLVAVPVKAYPAVSSTSISETSGYGLEKPGLEPLPVGQGAAGRAVEGKSRIRL